MHLTWFTREFWLECICLVKKSLMCMQLGAGTIDQVDNINTFVSSLNGTKHL